MIIYKYSVSEVHTVAKNLPMSQIRTQDDVDFEATESESDIKRSKLSKPNRSERAILVTNLPKSYNQRKVRRIFQDCGDIIHVDVVETLDKGSRVARVEFANQNNVLAAMTKNNKLVGALGPLKVSSMKDCTIFLTNFPPEYGVNEIKGLFSEAGLLAVNVRLPSLRFNANRRFAYIDFVDNQNAQNAVNILDGYKIGTYNLLVRLSDPTQKKVRSDAATKERREIIVMNLNPKAIEPKILEDLFQEFGIIESIKIPTIASEHENAIAFIRFGTAQAATNSLALNHTTFQDRKISVRVADRKEYLERKEVNVLLQTRDRKRLDRIIALFPISDKTTKGQIHKLVETKLSSTDSFNVYLVTDFNAVILEFGSIQTAAKASMVLNNIEYNKNLIKCGTISDMKKFKSKR